MLNNEHLGFAGVACESISVLGQHCWHNVKVAPLHVTRHHEREQINTSQWLRYP